MTPEQIADDCIREAVDLELDGPSFSAVILRQRIADAVRAATVSTDAELREEAVATVRAILQALQQDSEHPAHIIHVEPGAATPEAEQTAQFVAQQMNQPGATFTLPALMEAGQQYQFVLPQPPAPVLERLAWLLGLSAHERAFVAATLESPQERGTFHVYADWLEEHSRPEQATRLRAIAPRPGQVAVLSMPHPTTDEGTQHARRLGEMFADEHGCQVVVLFGAQTLDVFDEAQMAAHGWVPVTHWTIPMFPFHAACGADRPNQKTTEVRAHVTCPLCRRQMETQP